MKRILCFILAAMMCLSVWTMASCGVAEGDEKENDAATKGADQNQQENETKDLSYVCELPDDLDFGGEQINFLFANRPGRDDELVPNDTDDVANDLKWTTPAARMNTI